LVLQHLESVLHVIGWVAVHEVGHHSLVSQQQIDERADEERAEDCEGG
jgi:hypothetical protein